MAQLACLETVQFLPCLDFLGIGLRQDTGLDKLTSMRWERGIQSGILGLKN